jgi:hypothetical protein
MSELVPMLSELVLVMSKLVSILSEISWQYLNLSQYYVNCLVTFWTVLTQSKLPWHSVNCLDTIYTVLRMSGPVWILWTIWRMYEIFSIISTMSGFEWTVITHFKIHTSELSQYCMGFPVSLDNMWNCLDTVKTHAYIWKSKLNVINWLK